MQRMPHRTALLPATALAVLLTVGCGSTATVAGSGAPGADGGAPRGIAPHCAPVPGLGDLLAPGTAALFGEMHGTRQAPAFFADSVCGALAAGHPVSVGLEMPPASDGALATYLASAGGIEDRRRLLADPFWSRDYQDGRSSLAMLELVEDLRALRAAGQPLRVFTFDNAGRLSADEREQALADRTVAAVEAAGEDSVVLLLTGNLHARLGGGAPWDPDFVPLGERAAKRAPERRWIALNLSTTGGTAWTCTGGVDTCGSRSIPGGEARPVGLEVGSRGVGEPFHGTFHVGEISASPPAVSTATVGDEAAGGTGDG